jgi:hypothetical protein
MLKPLSFTLFLASLPIACGATGDTLAFSRSNLGAGNPLASFADCPALDASVTATGLDHSIVIAKACVKDDAGKYYAIPFGASQGSPLLLPPGHKYAFVYEFGAGWVPTADAAASAARAYVTAYVAPTGVTPAVPASGNATAEATPAASTQDVSSTVALDGDVLTHTLTDAPPDGVWVFSQLDFTRLYAAYIAAHPEPWIGGFSANFVTRDPQP